jgi:hypothetical protein
MRTFQENLSQYSVINRNIDKTERARGVRVTIEAAGGAGYVAAMKSAKTK